MDLRTLLASQLFVRAPAERLFAVTQPETGRRAVPAFRQEVEGLAFWARVAPGHSVELVAVDLPVLAAEAKRVGGLLVDPDGEGLLLDRADLTMLAAGEVPGEFATWLRGWGRLDHQPSEVLARLRRTHVHVITGHEPREESSRLYLLEKSEDGTLAVPCFSSAASLAQFAQVRRLFEGQSSYAVALVDGPYCLRAAAGLGAYVVVDPESPWEVQLEPTLL